VPSAFVRLESMPLTANGKLDRGALPVPDFAVTQKQFVAPRSAVEGELEAIWREVLGVNRVGIHDNFFALGGHSLTATRLAAQIRDRFQTDLPIRTIFETKSLAEMARAVEIAKEYQRAPVAIGANDEEF
jgi:acyl carrier protein